MKEDIETLEELIDEYKSCAVIGLDMQVDVTFREKQYRALEHLIKAYKEKDKDNNDLRRLYRRTAVKLRENGKEELADYFLAQINEVPTFTVDDDIDYYTEYYKLKEENEDLKNLANNKKWISPCYVAQNYIPVSLVEEKIEELNRKIKYEDNEKVIIWLHKQRKILQELLEKRK